VLEAAGVFLYDLYARKKVRISQADETIHFNV
jgi:hypothetical protein